MGHRETKRLASVADWLLDEGRELCLRSPDFFDQFCRHLTAAGFPLDRATLHIRQLHPQFLARTLIWTPDRGAEETKRGYGIQDSATYIQSPVKPIFEGEPAIRCRLDDPELPYDFPVLEELRAEGFTDYLIGPLYYSGGRPTAISIATRQKGGFSPEDIAELDALSPILGTVLELRETERTARQLLDVYIGPSAGDRVFRGTIQRGDGEVIHAVIWYCDLRGFTQLSQGMSLDQVIDLLNDYFDAAAQAVVEKGGEILKFIGDAVLAIFPLENGVRQCDVTFKRALDAADAALAAVDARNEERLAAGKPPFSCGIALHVGDVLYGNVGTADRLDFTVIGPAVNLAQRLETLSSALCIPLVLSSDFVELSGSQAVSLGRHSLKGLSEPQEAFTLPSIRVAA